MSKQLEMFKILDCGHEPTKTDHCGTGYGTIDNKTYCYACCADMDRQAMRETGKATLYLTIPSGDDVNDYYHYTNKHNLREYPVNGKLTNWPGSLGIPVKHVTKGRHNIARVRYDVWFCFEGQHWHGTQYGDNTQLCHCRRIKG